MQGIESPELESPKGVSAVADQPEGVMAAGGEFDESATCKKFPWCRVIKWSIVVSVVALVLYLVFRRRD